MTPEEITDKSLLRCTIKKSWHTAGRVLVAVSYAIVGLALAAIVAYGALNILPRLYDIASAAVAYIVSVLASIPLWIYGLTAIPLAIFGYSFLWCVARDLTDDDWESDIAVAGAVAGAGGRSD